MTDASVFIGCPCRGNPRMETAAWIAVTRDRFQADMSFVDGGSRPVQSARNETVRRFLKSGRDWMLWIDDDVVPPRDALDKMLAVAAEKSATIVAGQYPVLSPEGLASSVRPLDWPEGEQWPLIGKSGWPSGVFEVEHCGFGIMLVHRSTILNMGWPWFGWIERENGTETGEDIFFCVNARRKGFKIWCAGDVRCSHYKTLDLLRIVPKPIEG